MCVKHSKYSLDMQGKDKIVYKSDSKKKVKITT